MSGRTASSISCAPRSVSSVTRICITSRLVAWFQPPAMRVTWHSRALNKRRRRTPDSVIFGHPQKPSHNGVVADVAHVAHPSPGSGEEDAGRNCSAVADVAHVSSGAGADGRVCAQCGAGGDDLEPHRNGDRLVYLHDVCIRFWVADNDPGLDLPGFLD